MQALHHNVTEIMSVENVGAWPRADIHPIHCFWDLRDLLDEERPRLKIQSVDSIVRDESEFHAPHHTAEARSTAILCYHKIDFSLHLTRLEKSIGDPDGQRGRC